MSLHVPSGWIRGVLQDLVFFQRGFDITQAQQREGAVPVISSSGVTSFHDEAKVVGPGVVIGRKGTLGSVHFCPGDYWPHDTTLWSKDLRGNNARFVYYYLRSIDLKRFDVGNSNPTLNRNHIHDLPAAIPPHHIQERIAEILSAYDDLIENNRRRMALLEDAARQLYEEWFVRLRFPGREHTRTVNGVPAGWCAGKVADFYDTTSGGTPSRALPDFYTGDINWVKTQELNDDWIFQTDERITEDALARSSAKLFPANTVLVSIYGGTNIGRTGILAVPGATNQACCAIFPRHQSAHFIHAALYFRHERPKLIALGQGAAQTNISQQVLRSQPMVMPPAFIVDAFVRTIEPVFDQGRVLKRQNEKLSEARDLLLPRLMSGDVAA